MNVTEPRLRTIRQRALFNGVVSRAEIVDLCDTIRAQARAIADLGAALGAALDEYDPIPEPPSCATEPEACEHGIEHVTPDPTSRETTVCYTHQGATS